MVEEPSRRVLIYEKLRPGTFLVEELRSHGITGDLAFGPDSTLLRHAPLSEEQIIELAQGYPALLGVSGARLTRHVLKSLPDLRFVSKIGIGYDAIDVAAASDLGIKVTNTPSPIEIDCVAEHAIALLLAAAKRFDFYTSARLRDGGWLDPTVQATALRGRVLGMVGFGRIARAVARRLEPWGMQIVAYDIAQVLPQAGVRMVELDELVDIADFVSLHASTTSDGRALLDAARIARLKPGAIVINTGRGALIDQEALNQSLIARHITVAGLDVFEYEPPAIGDPLLESPNLLATPHAASNVPEAEHDMEHMAVTNLQQLFDGHESDSLVTTRSLTG